MICNNQQAEENDIAFHLLYSAVIYSSILRVIYVFIAIYDLEVEVFDIIAIYFNIDISKDVIIYMR